MLRVTAPANLRARNIPRKRFSAPYKVNKDLDVSPHLASKTIIEDEVFGRKEKNLSINVIPYYGDKLGKAQMRPYDDRKKWFWQKVTQEDIDKTIEKQNPYDYEILHDKTKGRRKWYDEYYDRWYERDGQRLAYRTWHSFDRNARKNTLSGITDPRIKINHVTKWKSNSNKGQWQYFNARIVGSAPSWAYFNSTEHEENYDTFDQYYQKYKMPTHFSDMSLPNQAFYYSWLTKSLILNNSEILKSQIEQHENLIGPESAAYKAAETSLAAMLNSFKKIDEVFEYNLDNDVYETKVWPESKVVRNNTDQIIMAIKSTILALDKLGNEDGDILAETVKSENSIFWYRGMGFQTKEIFEQPHGWQLHARPSSTLRSKKGLRHNIAGMSKQNSESNVEYEPAVPKFNWFEKTSRNSTDNPDIPNKLLDGVKLAGWHPHHQRLPWTRYHNMINSAGQNIRGGDLFPNYQESLLADKLEELPKEVKPSHNFVDWTFSEVAHHEDALGNSASNNAKQSHSDQSFLTEGLSQCFASSMGVAHAEGYWWEEDLEKPIITNHVVTDGEHIQFFTYQLNTVALDPATEKAELFGEIENKKNNVLWASKRFRIDMYNREFDAVSASNFLVEQLVARVLLTKLGGFAFEEVPENDILKHRMTSSKNSLSSMIPVKTVVATKSMFDVSDLSAGEDGVTKHLMASKKLYESQVKINLVKDCLARAFSEGDAQKIDSAKKADLFMMSLNEGDNLLLKSQDFKYKRETMPRTGVLEKNVFGRTLMDRVAEIQRVYQFTKQMYYTGQVKRYPDWLVQDLLRKVDIIREGNQGNLSFSLDSTKVDELCFLTKWFSLVDKRFSEEINENEVLKKYASLEKSYDIIDEALKAKDV